MSGLNQSCQSDFKCRQANVRKSAHLLDEGIVTFGSHNPLLKFCNQRYSLAY